MGKKRDLYEEAVAKLRQALDAGGWERARLLERAVQLHIQSLEEADDPPDEADNDDRETEQPRRSGAA